MAIPAALGAAIAAPLAAIGIPIVEWVRAVRRSSYDFNFLDKATQNLTTALEGLTAKLTSAKEVSFNDLIENFLKKELGKDYDKYAGGINAKTGYTLAQSLGFKPPSGVVVPPEYLAGMGQASSASTAQIPEMQDLPRRIPYVPPPPGPVQTYEQGGKPIGDLAHTLVQKIMDELKAGGEGELAFGSKKDQILRDLAKTLGFGLGPRGGSSQQERKLATANVDDVIEFIGKAIVKANTSKSGISQAMEDAIRDTMSKLGAKGALRQVPVPPPPPNYTGYGPSGYGTPPANEQFSLSSMTGPGKGAPPVEEVPPPPSAPAPSGGFNIPTIPLKGLLIAIAGGFAAVSIAAAATKGALTHPTNALMVLGSLSIATGAGVIALTRKLADLQGTAGYVLRGLGLVGIGFGVLMTGMAGSMKILAGGVNMLKDMIAGAFGPIAELVKVFDPALVNLFQMAVADTLAALGSALVPIIEAAIPLIRQVGDIIATMTPALEPLISFFVDIIGIIGDLLVPVARVLTPVLHLMGQMLKALVPIIRLVADILIVVADNFVKMMNVFIDGLNWIIRKVNKINPFGDLEQIKHINLEDLKKQDSTGMAVRGVSRVSPEDLGKKFREGAFGSSQVNWKKEIEDLKTRLDEMIRRLKGAEAQLYENGRKPTKTDEQFLRELRDAIKDLTNKLRAAGV